MWTRWRRRVGNTLFVSRSATHLEDRAETGQCNDLVEQNGLSVFIRGQLAWITGSIMTSSCKSSQKQKEKY